ncbi:MAG: serine O-acetyltransferase EpsC [Hyphomicrobium sp.]|nr:serine acetyltransferase [Hyphomicrobium sp.]
MTAIDPQTAKTQPDWLSIPLDQIVWKLRASRTRARNSIAKSAYARELPNPEVAAAVVKSIYAALFPRHGGGQDGTDEGIDYFVGFKLNTALRSLRGLLLQELRFSFAQQKQDDTAIESAVASILQDFAEGLPDVRENLLSDVRAAFDGDPAAQTTEEILLSYPGIRAIYHHRLAHELYRLGAPIVARIIAEISHSATGIDIHPGARIGGSFFIDHGTGVVIGETAVIGERVRLYQAVTLGAKRFTVEESGALTKGEPRHPIVEDDVVIYAGATVLGRVTIGHGSSIGGNVWLTRSVPPFSNIVQAQARSETFESGGGI